jgi:hypothetical protein
MRVMRKIESILCIYFNKLNKLIIILFYLINILYPIRLLLTILISSFDALYYEFPVLRIHFESIYNINLLSIDQYKVLLLSFALAFSSINHNTRCNSLFHNNTLLKAKKYPPLELLAIFHSNIIHYYYIC